ncbi:unnamed protein product [Dovyalis caffra]|uniref:F-box domain-containing protein n=1 Tax=Dovyalis caffra TaxID=77055 RepID=A0AAV1RX96_9ROSI|nr:unnamed protein product [Dovyalis caffra]
MINTKLKPGISSSGETIGTNHDLLIEILLRLPAKSLLKFNSVSKQWLSLISDPKFRFSHARHQRIRNPTPNSLMLNNYYPPTPEFQLVPLKHDTKIPFLDYLNVPRVKIEQSCNGLFICSSTYLVNPKNKEWERYITDTSFDYFADYCTSVVDDDDSGYSLVFDPLKSPFYKVICMREVNSEMGKFELDVYSSETESWGLLRIPFRKPNGMHLRAGVFCNGAVHWYSHDETTLYFDVDSESLKTMRMPPVVRRDKRVQKVMYFGESLGHLHMVMSDDHSALEFDVLEMASDYSRWTYTAFSVLGVVRAMEEEESTVVLFVDGRAMSYAFHSGTSNKICDIDPKPRFAGVAGAALDYEGHDAYQYFESLVCI